MPVSHLRSWLVLAATVAVLGGCATPAVPPAADTTPAPPPAVAAPPPARGPVIARSDDFAIVLARVGDTPAILAERYLGDATRAWWLTEYNGDAPLQPGQYVVVPLKSRNPTGIRTGGYQTVPILCYHRFGSRGSRLTVTGQDFQAQMEYLARNDYHVITLRQLAAFIEGNEALPPKSVVITIDDGYRSNYEIAYPILKRLDFPATVFLYSDFVGAPDALTWTQMKTMAGSGLIDIQPHSKTHANLTLRLPGETDARYRERVRREVDTPVVAIRERLDTISLTYAYPYGDVNESVIELLVRQNIRLGVTVTPGGNAFFAYPYMLHRSMVFGDEDLGAFRAKLATFTRTPAH